MAHETGMVYINGQVNLLKCYELLECIVSNETILLWLCYNRYDHPNILAGQGTMGLEIVEDVPDIDAAIIPIGGGGLIAGTALAIKSLLPEVKIIVS